MDGNSAPFRIYHMPRSHRTWVKARLRKALFHENLIDPRRLRGSTTSPVPYRIIVRRKYVRNRTIRSLIGATFQCREGGKKKKKKERGKRIIAREIIRDGRPSGSSTIGFIAIRWNNSFVYAFNAARRWYDDFSCSKKEQKKKSGMTHEFERVARISFHKGEEARSVESSTDTDRAETVFVWEEEKNGLAVINDSIV